MTTMTKTGRPYKAPRTPLDAFLKSQDLPLKVVAEKCKVSRQSLEYWASGKKKANLSALAKAYNISVDKLKDELGKYRSVEDIEKTMNFEDVDIDFRTAVELVPVTISSSQLQGGTDSWNLYQTICDVTGFKPSLRIYENFNFGVSAKMEHHTFFLTISGGHPDGVFGVQIEIFRGHVDETVSPDDQDDIPVATAYVIVPNTDELFVRTCRFIEQVFPVLQGQLSES